MPCRSRRSGGLSRKAELCGVAIKIKEYTEFKKGEIWQLYTQVG
jgi:hypothetical protein